MSPTLRRALHAADPESPPVDQIVAMMGATVVANDTAGGLLLLSLASGHPALGRAGRLVLTNCESYDQFPPDALKKASALSRAFPWLARTAIRLRLRQQLRRPGAASKGIANVTATGLDRDRA